MLELSFTPGVMLMMSLVAALFLFNGAFFSYSRHIALFTLLFLILLVTYISINHSMVCFSFYEYYQRMRHIHFLVTTGIGAFSFALTYITFRYIGNASPYIIIFVGALLTAMVTMDLIGANQNVTMAISLLIGSMILFLLLYKTQKVYFLIASSTLVGSSLLSTLFTSFYFFPTSVHIILFIVLLVSGFLIQNHTRKSKITKEVK